MSQKTSFVFRDAYRIHFGVGYETSLPAGWVLKQSPDDWAIGISPEGQEYYLGYPYAYPRRVAIEPFGELKAGDHYMDTEVGVLNLQILCQKERAVTKQPNPLSIIYTQEAEK